MNVIFSYSHWEKFRIMYLYLDQIKKKEREVQRHLLIQVYTGLKDFLMGITLPPFIVFLKNLTFLLFLVKCAITQVRCFKKWKNSKCIFSDLLRDTSHCGSHSSDKGSKILV